MLYRHLLFLAFAFSGAFIARAYPPDTLVYYFNDDGEICPKEEATYYRKSYKTDSVWQVSNYYLNGKLQMIGACLDKDLKVAHGKHIWYDENGRIKNVGNFKQGLIHGKWVYYHPNGQVSSMEHYYNDSLVNAQLWDADGSISKNRVIYIFAEFPGGEDAFFDFLQRNLSYPVDVEGKPFIGKVEYEITVLETGVVKDIEVTNTYDHSIAREFKRLVPLMPRWTPAIFHNIPQKSKRKGVFNFSG